MPRYETAIDLANERTVMQHITEKTGYQVVKNPPAFEKLDLSILDAYGTIRAFVEIKTRKNDSEKYPTLLVDLAKFTEGARHAQFAGVPFFIFVQYTDCIKYYKYDPTHKFRVAMGGRTFIPRNENDVEPVILIPTNFFRLLKGREDFPSPEWTNDIGE